MPLSLVEAFVRIPAPLTSILGCRSTPSKLFLSLYPSLVEHALLDWFGDVPLRDLIQVTAEEVTSLSPTGRRSGMHANVTPSDESMAVKR